MPRQMSNKEIRSVAEKYGIDPKALISDVRDAEADGERYTVQELEDALEQEMFNGEIDALVGLIESDASDSDNPGAHLEFDECGGSTNVSVEGFPPGVFMGMAHALYVLSERSGIDLDVLGEAILDCADNYSDMMADAGQHPEYFMISSQPGSDKILPADVKKKNKKDNKIPENVDKTLWD